MHITIVYQWWSGKNRIVGFDKNAIIIFNNSYSIVPCFSFYMPMSSIGLSNGFYFFHGAPDYTACWWLICKRTQSIRLAAGVAVLSVRVKQCVVNNDKPIHLRRCHVLSQLRSLQCCRSQLRQVGKPRHLFRLLVLYEISKDHFHIEKYFCRNLDHCN